MKLIVGLGNPGIEYQFTPHNIGFLAVDRIASDHGSRDSEPSVPGAYGTCSILPAKQFCWPNPKPT